MPRATPPQGRVPAYGRVFFLSHCTCSHKRGEPQKIETVLVTHAVQYLGCCNGACIAGDREARAYLRAVLPLSTSFQYCPQRCTQHPPALMFAQTLGPGRHRWGWDGAWGWDPVVEPTGGDEGWRGAVYQPCARARWCTNRTPRQGGFTSCVPVQGGVPAVCQGKAVLPAVCQCQAVYQPYARARW